MTLDDLKEKWKPTPLPAPVAPLPLPRGPVTQRILAVYDRLRAERGDFRGIVKAVTAEVVCNHTTVVYAVRKYRKEMLSPTRKGRGNTTLRILAAWDSGIRYTPRIKALVGCRSCHAAQVLSMYRSAEWAAYQQSVRDAREGKAAVAAEAGGAK